MDEDVLKAIASHFHSPKPFGEGGQSVVFLAQRGLVPDATQRWQYVVVKAPAQRPEHASFYDNELKFLERLAGVPGVPSNPRIILTPKFPLFITSIRSRDLHSPIPFSLERCQMHSTGVRTTIDLINWAVLAGSVTQTLCTIHALGVVHHDVKPGNIVLNTARGRWHGICVIDFGSALTISQAETVSISGTWEYLSPHRISEIVTHQSLRWLAPNSHAQAYQRSAESFANDDRSALGTMLIELAIGNQTLKTEIYPRAQLRLNTNDLDLDIDVICDATGRARNLVIKELDLQIKRRCSEKRFREWWCRVSRAYRNGVAVREWIAGLLSKEDSVVNRIVRICDRYLLGETGQTTDGEFTSTTDALLQFRTEIEYLLLSSARRPTELGIKGSPLKAQISSLQSLARPIETREWCKLYVTLPPQAPQTVDECLRQLRSGHGKSARLGLTRILLADGLHDVPMPAIISAARTLVGFLLPREGMFDDAYKVLNHIDGLRSSSTEELQAWSAILRQYLNAITAKNPIHAESHPTGFSDDRLVAWSTYINWLALRIAKPRDFSIEELDSAVSDFLAGSKSTTEMVSAMLLHAKLLSAAADAFEEPMILVRLVGAAAIARTKRLPYEYARTLRLAATLVFERLANATGRDLLPDYERLRELASGCAEHACEMFFFLERTSEAIECSLISAVGLSQSDDSELCVQALRTMSYAENLRRLIPGLPLAEIEQYKCEITSRFSPGANATDFDQILVQWRNALASAAAIYGTDPGSHFARGFYNKYGNPISSLWQTGGGLAVEICGNDHSPEQGAAVRHLWSLALKHSPRMSSTGRRLLDIGCGSGTDAVYAAAKLGYEVVAMDASSWCIEQAQQRYGGQRGVQFVHGDITTIRANDFRAEHGVFDVVLMRDSLCHISNKSAVLQISRALLSDDGVLLFSDWIQRSPTSLTEYLDMISLLEFTGLETLEGYKAMLEESAFTPLDMLDETDHMKTFWRGRLATLEAITKGTKSTSPQRSHFTKFHRVLKSLKAHTEGGVLGWVFCVAKPKVARRSYVTGYRERIQRIVPNYEHMVAIVQKIVASVRGARVLELGVGDGTMTAAIYKADAKQVTCVDHSPEVLKYVQELMTTEIHFGIIEILAGDVFQDETWARIGDSYYDIVVASLIFHDAPPAERAAFVRNIASKLKRSGCFVFVDPLRATRSFTARLDDWRDAGLLSESEIRELEEHDPIMFDPINAEDFHEFCRDAGLEYVGQSWTNYHFALRVFRKT